jgi:hypothetical protein
VRTIGSWVDPSRGQTTLAIEKGSEMDLRLPGLTLTRGPNLGLSRRTGLLAGIVLLVLGVLLLAYAIGVPQ